MPMYSATFLVKKLEEIEIEAANLEEAVEKLKYEEIDGDMQMISKIDEVEQRHISVDAPDSSWIERISYNGSGGLTIDTHTRTIQYNGVPEHVFENFKSADSKGKFYNDNIKGIYQREEN